LLQLKHLKHTLAICTFSVIFPCYFEMDDRRRMEFTCVELVTPVEKAAVGPTQKAPAGPRALEGRGGLPAPRDSHPCLPPAWRRGSPSLCSSPTRRSHVGLRSHRFLPCVWASELPSPCLRAGSRTREAQWSSEMWAARAHKKGRKPAAERRKRSGCLRASARSLPSWH
jgi:hypothetical protein